MENEEGKKENTIYCPICHGPVEETGKPTWAYCHTHGWVKFKSYRSHDEKKSEDLFGKINDRASILTKHAEEKIDGIRKKSPLFAYIVPALFLTVLLAFLIGYFFWRDTSHKILETKKEEVEIQKDVTSQQNDQMIESQPRVSVSPDVPIAVALDKEKEVKKEKRIEAKLHQTQNPRQMKKLVKQTQQTALYQQPSKPSKPVFTVQAGAFRDASRAESLKATLHKRGYVVSVVPIKSKEGEKLYKVFVGEFKERKKAQSIAQEIGKQESIQTFVTIR
jgi:cell division septation protein DedD